LANARIDGKSKELGDEILYRSAGEIARNRRKILQIINNKNEMLIRGV
jgi:hypothetical protein